VKVYTLLAVFAPDSTIVDSQGKMPAFELDGSAHSLDVIRDSFSNITGISQWEIYFNQEKSFESKDSVFIPYTCFFPEKFDIKNTTYRWQKLIDCNKDDVQTHMIRYLATVRM